MSTEPSKSNNRAGHESESDVDEKDFYDAEEYDDATATVTKKMESTSLNISAEPKQTGQEKQIPMANNIPEETVTLETDSSSSDTPTDMFVNSGSENEDFDSVMPTRRRIVNSRHSRAQKKPDSNQPNREETNETTSKKNGDDNEEKEEKFVPLHEELNQEMKEIKENKKKKYDIDDDEDEGLLASDIDDPDFVDEAGKKIEEEKLSPEELEERFQEAQAEKLVGNSLFKEENYNESIESYTKALRICPLINNKERAIFYSNRSICYLKLKDTKKCIRDCTKSIELDKTFVKPLLRRAECYQTTDKLDEALEDYKSLCELEPSKISHKQNCFHLEQTIKERNEKLKEEMMGKLKDLGNMVLKPFGLSTNNFQFVQDPTTGSYSVNFTK